MGAVFASPTWRIGIVMKKSIGSLAVDQPQFSTRKNGGTMKLYIGRPQWMQIHNKLSVECNQTMDHQNTDFSRHLS